MASFHKTTILIALIFMISTTISIAYRDLSEDGSEDVHDGDDWGFEDGDGDIDYDPENGDRDRDDGDNSDIGRYLRDLCSETKQSKQCWKIIKPEITRFTDTNSRNVAGVVIDLANAKSGKIREKLEQLRKDSNDDDLKEKYRSCSSNYHDINRDLDIVKTNLHSDNYGKFSSGDS